MSWPQKSAREPPKIFHAIFVYYRRVSHHALPSIPDNNRCQSFQNDGQLFSTQPGSLMEIPPRNPPATAALMAMRWSACGLTVISAEIDCEFVSARALEFSLATVVVRSSSGALKAPTEFVLELSRDISWTCVNRPSIRIQSVPLSTSAPIARNHWLMAAIARSGTRFPSMLIRPASPSRTSLQNPRTIRPGPGPWPASGRPIPVEPCGAQSDRSPVR